MKLRKGDTWKHREGPARRLEEKVEGSLEAPTCSPDTIELFLNICARSDHEEWFEKSAMRIMRDSSSLLVNLSNFIVAVHHLPYLLHEYLLPPLRVRRSPTPRKETRRKEKTSEEIYKEQNLLPIPVN